jgi:hypothetical protein
LVAGQRQLVTGDGLSGPTIFDSRSTCRQCRAGSAPALAVCGDDRFAIQARVGLASISLNSLGAERRQPFVSFPWR